MGREHKILSQMWDICIPLTWIDYNIHPSGKEQFYDHDLLPIKQATKRAFIVWETKCNTN